MGEDTIPFFEDEIKDTMQGIIKVVGVGGGGCNAVRNMCKEVWRVLPLLPAIRIVSR